VFDAAAHAEAVAAGLSSLCIDPGKVEAVFLTHSDYDHIAAVGLFPNARVLMSDKEVSMVNGTMHRAFVFDNKANFTYSTIADGETMQVGSRSVKAIVTPGHTAGSACYLVDGKYLFTGDTISVRGGKIGTFNDVFNMDSKLQSKSIGKIASLRGVEKILTAHYGALGGADSLFAEWNAGKR
jgi:glyoxylase-like metal-dependent hydrolase (beta-lactamase superfamily II)